MKTLNIECDLFLGSHECSSDIFFFHIFFLLLIFSVSNAVWLSFVTPLVLQVLWSLFVWFFFSADIHFKVDSNSTKQTPVISWFVCLNAATAEQNLEEKKLQHFLDASLLKHFVLRWFQSCQESVKYLSGHQGRACIPVSSLFLFI